MIYGDEFYVGRSSKTAPALLGVGFALGAWAAWRAGDTLVELGLKEHLALPVKGLAVALAGGALLYGSGRGRLIGDPSQVSPEIVEQLAAVQVPALPPPAEAQP